VCSLQGAIKILNKDRLADEKNIRGLSRWKDENDLKDQKITNYRMLALNATENVRIKFSFLSLIKINLLTCNSGKSYGKRSSGGTSQGSQSESFAISQVLS
jgi:hypothetical protein